MDIANLQQSYASQTTSPEEVIRSTYEAIERDGTHPVWISIVPKEQALQRCRELAGADRAQLPLFGIPFAVKDNIDVAGIPTTAGCPAYAYTPDRSATVVERLEAAGGILVGKTNMDQFATGLVGTRSPYGACSCVFNAHYISGGSSSGSAVAVAKGLVSFALGTDTAGSGRVPAAFNNLVGLKPTRGVVSARGVVPACRSLDCVSIFAETVADAATVLDVLRGFDAEDPYARKALPGAGAAPWSAGPHGKGSLRLGVLTDEHRAMDDEVHNYLLYESAIQAAKQLGVTISEIDISPFLSAAKLLYQGPWVAERLAAIETFYQQHASEMDPVVAGIIGAASKCTAVQAFEGEYQLRALRRAAERVWDEVDALLLPTVNRQFTLEAIAQFPVARNAQLGTYTNFVNLLDLAAVAIPAGMRPDGLAFGVTLMGPAFTEAALLPVADDLHRSLNASLGGGQRKLMDTPPLRKAEVPHGCQLLAVVGAHLTGQPLNWQLTQRGGRLVRTCRTHPDYRLYALRGTVPPKPGLVWTPGFEGPGIEVEIWALPTDGVGSFVEGIPSPLGIGTLRLEDGTQVRGFIVEPAGVENAMDITHFGGWRAYLRSRGSGS